MNCKNCLNNNKAKLEDEIIQLYNLFYLIIFNNNINVCNNWKYCSSHLRGGIKVRLFSHWPNRPFTLDPILSHQTLQTLRKPQGGHASVFAQFPSRGRGRSVAGVLMGGSGGPRAQMRGSREGAPRERNTGPPR